MTALFSDSDWKKARKFLKRKDSALYEAASVATLLPPSKPASAFDTLARIILDQQISIKAAASIRAKLCTQLGSKTIRQADLSQLSEEELQACGVSRQKRSYLRSLCEEISSKNLNLRRLWNAEEEEVIESLVAVKGIGNWSAEMFLIFCLGRADVFSAGDLGLRNAMKKIYVLPDHISEAELIEISQAWRPWRSIASLYLWNSL